jgi:hypothetical protein
MHTPARANAGLDPRPPPVSLVANWAPADVSSACKIAANDRTGAEVLAGLELPSATDGGCCTNRSQPGASIGRRDTRAHDRHPRPMLGERLQYQELLTLFLPPSLGRDRFVLPRACGPERLRDHMRPPAVSRYPALEEPGAGSGSRPVFPVSQAGPSGGRRVTRANCCSASRPRRRRVKCSTATSGRAEAWSRTSRSMTISPPQL